MQKNNKVKLNTYKFYELVHKPTQADLEEYYATKYYQTGQGSYETTYSKGEILHFKNKIKQKYFAINRLLSPRTGNNKSLLDIGCGEGFGLSYFKEKWGKKGSVMGLDYSKYGCKKFNPHCISNLIVGDISQNILSLVRSGSAFDVIWLDNVLEHVLDPLSLLKQCKKLLKKNGVLMVEVPNDFSVLQKYLIDKKYVNSEYWVVPPDHISYFNREGLTAIATKAGFHNAFTMSDYPIDVNLLNRDTNYKRDATKGKNVYRASIELENLIHAISLEKTVAFNKALADLGLGRCIVSFFQHDSK